MNNKEITSQEETDITGKWINEGASDLEKTTKYLAYLVGMDKLRQVEYDYGHKLGLHAMSYKEDLAWTRNHLVQILLKTPSTD
jgi:hypothetical protein